MKKLFIIGFVLLFVCSCKKEYNCYCNTTVIYPDGSQGVSNFQGKAMSSRMTKKQAQSVCNQEALSINSTLIKFYSGNGSYQQYAEANTKCTLQ